MFSYLFLLNLWKSLLLMTAQLCSFLEWPFIFFNLYACNVQFLIYDFAGCLIYCQCYINSDIAIILSTCHILCMLLSFITYSKTYINIKSIFFKFIEYELLKFVYRISHHCVSNLVVKRELQFLNGFWNEGRYLTHTASCLWVE